MARVLITGANGFIGRETCAAFTRAGHHVTAAVRDKAKAHGIPCAEIFESVSLARDPGLDRVLKNTTAIVHCAGWNGSKPNGISVDAIASANTAEARQLCERGAASGVPHFILLSSIKAVAATTSGTPLAEDATPHPSDAYGRSKLAIEKAIADVPGISKSIVRPPAIYGPGMTGGLATLFRLAARGVPLPVKGVANRRDILALPSLADCLVRCVEAGDAQHPGPRALHVRDGSALSTAQLYVSIGRALNKPVRLYTWPNALLRTALLLPGTGSKVESLLQSLELNDTKSRQILQWAPTQRMDDVLESTAKWILGR